MGDTRVPRLDSLQRIARDTPVWPLLRAACRAPAEHDPRRSDLGWSASPSRIAPGKARRPAGYGVRGSTGVPVSGWVRPGGNHRCRGSPSPSRNSASCEASSPLSERPFRDGMLPSCSLSFTPCKHGALGLEGKHEMMSRLVGLRGCPPWPSSDGGCHRRCLRGPSSRVRAS